MKFKSVHAIRILSSAITAINTVAMVVMKGPSWMGFLLGMSVGLGVGLLVVVWSGKFACLD